MFELIGILRDYYLAEGLLVAGIALVLIDYFFATDIPCLFGYACFAGSVFLWLDQSLPVSLFVAVAVWLLLLAGHRFWWGAILNRAPVR